VTVCFLMLSFYVRNCIGNAYYRIDVIYFLRDRHEFTTFINMNEFTTLLNIIQHPSFVKITLDYTNFNGFLIKNTLRFSNLFECSVIS